MALSLKNPETERLARQLAQLTGESVTLAVTIALKERLDRQEQAVASPSPRDRLDALVELSSSTAPLFTNGKNSKEMLDELYDENGLPR